MFGKIDDRNQLDKVYQHWIENPKLNRKSRAALTFFYNIRRDEMDDPDYWSKVGMGKLPENKQEPMKAKLVKEFLNEGVDTASAHKAINKWGPKVSKLGAGMIHMVDDYVELRKKKGYNSNSAVEVLAKKNGISKDTVLDVLRDAEGLKAALNENRVFESMSRYCDIYKASDGKWYMDLANEEYGEYDDCTSYGPFSSEEAADKYLSDNHSNPGGGWVDDSGDREPPTESPNGSRLVNPRSGGGGGFIMGGGYGRRW